ncbi:HEAT repeat domain-containing protein [Paenibacillus sp. CN-4]|uniref:HEAT repeat domain-containing protein n=1 Tax=Paenibacillus nanchangensis TaxID=3348343 RepID=UPI0039785417
MNNEDNKQELPEHYDQLKKAANRSADWRARLEAVQELGKWEHPQTMDILTRLMNSDPVYKVQEAAYEKLRALGQDVQLPSPNKPEPFKGLSKIMLRIRKSLPREHTFEDFKEKLRKMRIDIYDTYEGIKGDGFDEWLKKQWEAAGK